MKAPLHSTVHASVTTWGCAPNPRRPRGARGETPAAFDRRCIPHRTCVGRLEHKGVTYWEYAPSSRLVPAGRGIDTGGSLCDAGFHHGLLAGTPSPRAAPAEAHCVRHYHLGLRPKPPAALAGTPSPRAAPAEAHCVRHYHLGLRPKPPAALAGTPSPRAAPAEAHCVRLGAAPQTPGGGDPFAPRRSARRLRPPRRTVCGAAPQTPGGDPFAPRRDQIRPPRRTVCAWVLGGRLLECSSSPFLSCVVPRSHMLNMLPRHVLSARRLTGLCATRGFTTDS